MVIGKWGCGDDGSTGIRTSRDLITGFGYLDQTDAHHYYPPFLWRNARKCITHAKS